MVSVSGPKRSDNISECPSSGEVARRMNNTINETIAQHESAIGLGVSAIEVDIYMPYELNHLSAECRKQRIRFTISHGISRKHGED